MRERTLKLAVLLNVLILMFSMFAGGMLARGDTGITEGIDSEEENVEIEEKDDEASGSFDPTEVLYGGGDEEITEGEGNEGVERTFLRATDIRADSPAVYLDEDNTLYVTIRKVGGDAGDDSYTENITAYIEEIEDLIDEYEDNRRVNRLEKAVEELEEALVQVSEHQREDSIRSVRGAVVRLNAAGAGGCRA